MEELVTRPGNAYEFILDSPWPVTWAYGLLGLLLLYGLLIADWKVKVPRWTLLLPMAWLLWEFLAAATSVRPELSKPTVAHFFACALCFYFGIFCLSDLRRAVWVFPGILCGFLIVVAVGWQQHFGGLEQTRQYFLLYVYPRLKKVSPEYLKKLSSTRIFSTLFYPNALAGAVLLFLPALLEFVWQARRKFTLPARAFLVTTIGIAAVACLYWSGSKGGWLLMLILGLIWLLHLPFDLRAKRALIGLVLVAGLGGFFVRYSGFFHKGATSVSARFDYWQAAIHTTLAHPWVGTGPGTFAIAYQRVKRPESEMSRLVHNDYLEQASDSGLPGLLFYGGWIVSALILTAPRFSFFRNQGAAGHTQKSERIDGGGSTRSDSVQQNEPENCFEAQVAFALWLGLLGWALQGLMEFGLYLPALAWPVFTFMGLLLAARARGPGMVRSPALRR